MAWSKIKTIIIVILLLLNLFLLVLVVGQQMRSARYEADTLRQTVEALYSNGAGISVDEDLLPRSMDLAALSVPRDEAAEAKVAAALLTGDIIANSTGGLSVYSSVSGNVSFRSNGDFSATLSLPASGYSSPEDHAAGLLEQLGVQTWSLSADGERVTAVQAVNGAPAVNARLTLTYSGESLVSMEGKLLLGAAGPEPEQGESITVPTALVSFLDYVVENGDICSSISRMTAGYLTAASLSSPIRLTPCWLIDTDVASYCVDAVTGDVTRLT